MKHFKYDKKIARDNMTPSMVVAIGISFTLGFGLKTDEGFGAFLTSYYVGILPIALLAGALTWAILTLFMSRGKQP